MIIPATTQTAARQEIGFAVLEAYARQIDVGVTLEDLQSEEGTPKAANVAAVWMDGIHGRLYIARTASQEFERIRWEALGDYQGEVLFLDGHGDGAHVYGGAFTICADVAACRSPHPSGRLLDAHAAAAPITVAATCNSATYGCEQSAFGRTLLRSFLRAGCDTYIGFNETAAHIPEDFVPQIWSQMRAGMGLGSICRMFSQQQNAGPVQIRLHGDPERVLRQSCGYTTAVGRAVPARPEAMPTHLTENERYSDLALEASRFAEVCQTLAWSADNFGLGSDSALVDRFQQLGSRAVALKELASESFEGGASKDDSRVFRTLAGIQRELEDLLTRAKKAPLTFDGFHFALLLGLHRVDVRSDDDCPHCTTRLRRQEFWDGRGKARLALTCPRCGPVKNLSVHRADWSVSVAAYRYHFALFHKRPESLQFPTRTWAEVRSRDVRYVMGRATLNDEDAVVRPWRVAPDDDDTLLRLWSVNMVGLSINLSQQRANSSLLQP